MNPQKELLDKFLRNEANIIEKRQLAQGLTYPESWDEDFREVWENSDGELMRPVDNRVWGKVKRGIKSVRKPGFQRMWAVAASMVAVILGGSTLYLWNEVHNGSYDNDFIIEVEKGQKSNITLPDGTRVRLNSDSKLSYSKAFARKERTVKFSGEAYFEVFPDPYSPFNVVVNDVMVQATGTSFNIQAYLETNHITTYLASGCVNVFSPTGQVSLLPGEKSDYNMNTRLLTREKVADPLRYLAWMDNLLVFEEEPLENILQLLERNYNVRFTLTNDTIKQQRFGGTLNNSSLQNILDILSLTSKLSYKVNNDEIELSYK